MDAKPQRPMRSLKVYDENALPAMGAHKTIHQRNKSSPALSSLAQGGALRAAAKRTAFGDLGITAGNLLRPSRDDSTIGAKVAMQSKENLPPLQSRKSSTFTKPAQRPLSVAGLRTGDAGSLQNIRQPLGEVSQLPSHITTNAEPVTRKAVAKRTSAVFRDPIPSAHARNEPSVAASHQSLPSVQANLSTQRELPSVPAPQGVHLIPQPLPTISRSEGAFLDASDFAKRPSIAAGLEAAIDPALQGLSNGANPSVLPRVESSLAHGSILPADELTQPALRTVATLPAEPIIPVADLRQPSTAHERDHDRLKGRRLPSIAEPEGEWAEYDHAVNPEDDGYLTGRSFKSKADTTGGATTVLFPKATLATKKEVAYAKKVIEQSKSLEELEDEAWDTTMVAEYGDEIFQYMKDLETRMLPNAHYMDNQAEIQWSMRAVLMEWIVQVHHRFNLLPETLFLCVNYIDRFLSCKVVSLGKLQLVGITAIFIAAKYEEIDCPSVQEIIYMVDGGYTVDELLKAERFMLSMLQFELGWPGPMSFLRRISKADDYDLETRTLAKYFLELTIMDERFIGCPPSFIAAGAHCLARLMLRKGRWSTAHVYYSEYTYSQLHDLINLMVECCETPRKHHSAIYEKYMDKRYKRASVFAEAEMKAGFKIPEVSTPLHVLEPELYNTGFAEMPSSLPSGILCEA